MKKADFINMLIMCNLSDDFKLKLNEHDIELMHKMTIKRLQMTGFLITSGYVKLANVINESDVNKLDFFRKCSIDNTNGITFDDYTALLCDMIVKYDL